MNIWDRQPAYNSDPPLFYMGTIPMYLTNTLILAHVCTMVLGAILIGSGNESTLAWMGYVSTLVSNERMVTIFTYPWIHSISIIFALEMLVFYMLGREVESYLGRTVFGCLYAILAIIPPVTLSIANFFGLGRIDIYGSDMIHFGILISFAMLYPNVAIFFGVTAKWIAVVLIGIYSLAHLAYGRIPEFFHLWLSVGTCYATMRYIGAGVPASFGIGDQIRDWKQERSEKKILEKKRRLQKAEQQFHRDVDDILEKIAREGISSLTQAEKDALENARAKLLNQDRKK